MDKYGRRETWKGTVCGAYNTNKNDPARDDHIAHMHIYIYIYKSLSSIYLCVHEWEA